jgi:hypothetical protein
MLSLGLPMPFFFLISPILNNAPKVETIAHYFPDQAGSRTVHTHRHDDIPFGPVASFFISFLQARLSSLW